MGRVKVAAGRATTSSYLVRQHCHGSGSADTATLAVVTAAVFQLCYVVVGAAALVDGSLVLAHFVLRGLLGDGEGDWWRGGDDGHGGEGEVEDGVFGGSW